MLLSLSDMIPIKFQADCCRPSKEKQIWWCHVSLLPEPLVENTRAGPTRRAEGDPFQCRERAGRAQGSLHLRAWTRDLAPRDPPYLVRLTSLDPDCPCTFPAADLPARSRPITAPPRPAQPGVNRLPACDGLPAQPDRPIPYDIVCPPSQSHHHIRIHFCTTTP